MPLFSFISTFFNRVINEFHTLMLEWLEIEPREEPLVFPVNGWFRVENGEWNHISYVSTKYILFDTLLLNNSDLNYSSAEKLNAKIKNQATCNMYI